MLKSIIFIPGWGAGPEMWQGIINRLRKKFEISFLAWEECVKNRELASQRVLKNGNRPMIAAWSLGSLIALRAAHDLGGRISGLFLMSATARMAGDEGYQGAEAGDIRAMAARINRSKQRVIKDFSKNCFYPGDGGADFETSAEKFSGADLILGLEFLLNEDVRGLLAGINVPVVLMHGRNDRIVPLQQAEFINRNIRGSTLKITETGHALPFTDAEDAAFAIGGFNWL
jgi:pimeloyl-[acyl-carrier protein] methyl ester esterase